MSLCSIHCPEEFGVPYIQKSIEALLQGAAIGRDGRT
jgi:hypothetical protein